MGMRLQADFSDILKQLDSAVGAAGKAIAFGLYDTAAIVRAAVAQEAAGLPFKGSTVGQIVASIGVATFRDTGDGKQTSIDADGYFADSGFPIPFFVREVEHGTSKIAANPFIQRAAARAIAQAEAAGVETAEKIINDELK
jgi:hypothetical protein